MAQKKPENMSFEASLEELEQIVRQLESGDTHLDDALKLYERGVQLARSGQQKLSQAEQKVQILQADSDELAPFSTTDPEH